MPQISIVLPVYNMEHYLKATIDSILSQSYTDFELICIDDGSTDNSMTLLNEYASRDSRISVYSQHNAGPGVTRNNGLNKATGKYVMMLDADDIYHSDMLELLHSKAIQLDADIVACKSNRFDNETGAKLDSWWMLNESQIPEEEPFNCRNMPDYIFTAFMGWPWDKMFSRAFIEKHGLRYPALSNSEDLYFVFLALAKAERIGIVERELIDHRGNRKGSVSGSRAKDPLAFYTSTCLLKSELQKDPELYQKLSWGFLNWAFGYMVWNIETMDDPEAKSIQLDALSSGKFTELEIEGRSPAFFSLDPNVYNRYRDLPNMADQTNPGNVDSFGHRILAKVIHLLQRLYAEGFCSTAHAYCSAVKEKITGDKQFDEGPKLSRGEAFIAIPTQNNPR